MSDLQIPKGSLEFVGVTVTELNGLDLDAATVEISIRLDGAAHTWRPAQWDGAQWQETVRPGVTVTKRKARTTSAVDFTAFTATAYQVYVRPTDNPEAPIIEAGTLLVTS